MEKKEKINFSQKQIQFMKQYDVNYNDFEEIDDKISVLLMTKGFKKNYIPTEIGIMCESILDTLAEIDQ